MIKSYQLKNGIQVAMEPMEGYASAAIGLWVHSGSVFEKKENNGMAHAIEHMLFKGTPTRSAKRLADEMTEIGGNVEAYTTREYTCFYAKVLGEDLSKAVELLADMICHSNIDEEDLQNELRVIADEIDMYDDSPEDIAGEQLQKQIWRDQSIGYQISGDKAQVLTFTAPQLRAFKEAFYTGHRICITAAGCLDPDQLYAQLEEAFADLPEGEPVTFMPEAVYTPSVYCQEKDTQQVHVIMAFPGPKEIDEERYTYTVVNNIIGGNANSRLFQAVREEMGLSYAIYSYGTSFRNAGSYQIYACVQPEETEAVIRAVAEEVMKLRQEPITEREMAIARRQIRSEIWMASESTMARMNRLARDLRLREPFHTVADETDRIMQVTTEDAKAFTEHWLRFDRMSLALVGNLDTLPEDKVRQLVDELRGLDA